jgi:predicted dehydrogenase
LKQVFVGLPVDPAGEVEPEMPVPKNLNYDMWLGCTPLAYYTEKRVHPQSPNPRVRYDRPGWLRCEQFGAGMITGWGAHHIDAAHWAMDAELTGPVAVEALAQFPKKGLWDVHGPFHVRAGYAGGVAMYISEKYPTGIRFVGEDGWIWVDRGNYKPGDSDEGKPRSRALDASDLRILRSGIKDSEIHLHVSPKNDHHLDWLTSIRTRKPPAAPAEVGHRSCSACLLAHAAMRLGRPLKFDPAAERFVNDEEANGMLSRKQRAPYGTDLVLAKAGLT